MLHVSQPPRVTSSRRHNFHVSQAHKLHQLRNEYGEKVAFFFAFRAFHTRWLRLPAALGTALAIARVLVPHHAVCAARYTSPGEMHISPAR